MTTLKTVLAQKMAINACLLLICLVIIFCLCKRSQMLLVSALCCSSPLFQREQSEPFAKHKGYPWSKVTCTMMASFFHFFFQCSFREKNMELSSQMSLIEKRGNCLGLERMRAAVKTRVNAVILSINISIWLGGWCQVSICQRETGWHRHCLTLQYGRPRHKIENYHPFLGLA